MVVTIDVARVDAGLLKGDFNSLLNLITTLAEVNQKITKTNIDTIRDKSITIFAQNLVGLKNLYKLISFSHIKHFYRIPRILKSELVEHKEGLLIGTGGQ